MAFGASYKLETRLQWKLARCFMLVFYSNIKIAGQWSYLLYLRGVISFFLGFLMGFSVKSSGVGDPLDGVSVKRMGFQWGWLKVSGVALKVNGVNFQ